MNSLAVGLLSGIAGGATAYGNELRLEAEEARKKSFLELQHEYAKENTMLQNTLADASESEKYNRNRVDAVNDKAEARTNALTDKYDDREYNSAQDFMKNQEASARAKELARFQDGLLANRPTESDKKTALLEKMLKEGRITEEEYKNNILGLQKTATQGALTKEQKLKAVSELTAEYNADPEAKGEKNYFSPNKPSMTFTQWAKQKHPEEYNIIYGEGSDSQADKGTKTPVQEILSKAQASTHDGKKAAQDGMQQQQENVASLAGDIRKEGAGLIAPTSNTSQDPRVLLAQLPPEKAIDIERQAQAIYDRSNGAIPMDQILASLLRGPDISQAVSVKDAVKGVKQSVNDAMKNQNRF